MERILELLGFISGATEAMSRFDKGLETEADAKSLVDGYFYMAYLWIRQRTGIGAGQARLSYRGKWRINEDKVEPDLK